MRTNNSLSKIVDGLLRVASYASVALLWLLSMQKMAFTAIQLAAADYAAEHCHVVPRLRCTQDLAQRTARTAMLDEGEPMASKGQLQGFVPLCDVVE